MRTDSIVVLRFEKWILHDDNTVSPRPDRFAVYHRSGTYRVVGPNATIYNVFSDEIGAVNSARRLNKVYDLGMARNTR